jgi:hypothetical protein
MNAADSSVTITINGQQLEFVERVRQAHYPGSSVEELVRRALAEWGAALAADPPPEKA